MIQTFCVLYTQNNDIEKGRDGAFDGLVKQSKKVIFLSDKDHPPLVEVGNTFPGYDSSISDPCNLMTVNIEVNDNQCYIHRQSREYYRHYTLERNSEYVPNHLLTLQTFQRK